MTSPFGKIERGSEQNFKRFPRPTQKRALGLDCGDAQPVDSRIFRCQFGRRLENGNGRSPRFAGATQKNCAPINSIFIPQNKKYNSPQ